MLVVLLLLSQLVQCVFPLVVTDLRYKCISVKCVGEADLRVKVRSRDFFRRFTKEKFR